MKSTRFCWNIQKSSHKDPNNFAELSKQQNIEHMLKYWTYVQMLTKLQKFLATNLNILCNYFDDPNKIIFRVSTQKEWFCWDI